MECIICKDAGDEPLHDNTSCKCKYKYHNSCWVDYVNSKETLQCLMCRTKIGATPKTKSRLFNPPPPSAPPYAPQPLTFQEFREVLGLPRNPVTQTTHNTTTPLITPRSQSSPQPEEQQQTNRRKPFSEMTPAEKGKFVLGAICIVAVVVMVIVIITSVL